MATIRTTANTDPGPFLSTDQAAELLGLAAGTLRNWRWSKAPGKPRHYYLGRGKLNPHVRYRQSDVLAYKQQQDAATAAV